MGEENKVRKAKDSKKIKNLVDQWVKNKEYLIIPYARHRRREIG